MIPGKNQKRIQVLNTLNRLFEECWGIAKESSIEYSSQKSIIYLSEQNEDLPNQLEHNEGLKFSDIYINSVESNEKERSYGWLFNVLPIHPYQPNGKEVY